MTDRDGGPDANAGATQTVVSRSVPTVLRCGPEWRPTEAGSVPPEAAVVHAECRVADRR
jgi:hypothetical protein